jgi:hypothetical protein
MARRSVRRPTPTKPPKPKAPILTAQQKRRRIEQLKKCIRDLQAFDPQKVQKRFAEPEVFALEAAVDKALASAFGHGTSTYMRYNRPRRSTTALLLRMLRLAAPQSLPSPANQEARMNRRKHGHFCPRERSGRSTFSAKRFTHLRMRSQN